MAAEIQLWPSFGGPVSVPDAGLMWRSGLSASCDLEVVRVPLSHLAGAGVAVGITRGGWGGVGAGLVDWGLVFVDEWQRRMRWLT